MLWSERVSRISKWSPWCLLGGIVLSRTLAVVFFQHFTVLNDSGIAIRPGGYPAYLDYALYKEHMHEAWAKMSRPFDFIWQLQGGKVQALAWLRDQKIAPGPVLPALLGWTNFEVSQAPLSTAYLVAGGALGWAWALWVRHRGAAVWLQWLVACFPALIYYSLLVSTDLLYALVIAFWFAGACKSLEQRGGAWWWCSAAMAAALLIRPNALALLPLMFVLTWRDKSLHWRRFASAIWIAVGVCMFIYYLPYYWVHEGNAGQTHYWGRLPAEFYSGLWPNWPAWLSQPLSWLLLAAAKLLHAVGLRPSYSDMNGWLVLARAWPGLLMLPGLIYGLLNGRWFDRWFVIFFMVPVFVGAAQERYLLPITPLLLLWGVQAWACALDRASKRLRVPG